MKKNVIVVGMPRSGTSLTASIFAKQGYFVSQDEEAELRHGDAHNPDGYFEASPLVEANARVLGRAGFPHHNTWLFDPITSDQAHAIKGLEPLDDDRQLLADYERNRPWVWKDPRLCYTLGYWWPLVDKEHTCVLLARREESQIWNSFVRLGWREPTDENKHDISARIDHHIEAAKKSIQRHSIPYIEVNYDDYAKDPHGVAERINAAMNTRVTAETLGYRSRHNHSKGIGVLERWLRRLVALTPAGFKSGVKRLLPKSLLSRISF